MPAQDTDRNLLFGILALLNNFIDREALLAAFTAWVVDKNRSLGEILCEQGKLTRPQEELLRALAKEHVLQHRGDAQQSLAALSSVGSIRHELVNLGDGPLAASVAHVSMARRADGDPYATETWTAGNATSQGSRFRVLRPHAQGGLGKVSVARDEELHREVAFKEIRPEFADDPGSRARFTLEAEITGGLEHPGIVPVYGLGAYGDGRPFYAMRFIKGDSLKEAIERFHRANERADRDPGERSVELRKLLGRFIDVCHAIEYAHSRGVLHRDLKPGNIMLGKYGETLVVDWGLSKAMGSRENRPDCDTSEFPIQPVSGSELAPTEMGAHGCGTLPFMSPEQATGRLDLLGPQTDVYSLGATLYQLLTNQPAFKGSDRNEMRRKVEKGEFAHPREVSKAIPPALDAICLKAMAREPRDRYRTALEIVDDLEHWLADEPVSCFAESFPARARRWMKRHRTLVVSSVAAVGVLVMSLSVLLVLVAGHNRALDAKNRQLDEANTQLAQTNTKLQEANQAERAARTEANQKRIEAETARDETKQVLDYLVAAFRKSDPDSDGEKLTVAALFGQAAEQLEMTFPNQPLIQAQFLNAIGQTYLGLGLYPKAIVVFERARDLRHNALADDHQDMIGSMNNLATAYHIAGRLAEALQLNQQTLELSKAKLGAEHPDTLRSMNNLAEAYLSAGRLADALPLYEQTLKQSRVSLGPAHPHTLASMNNLAAAYVSTGKLPEALSLYEQALELMTAKFGPAHPTTLTTMNNLAAAYVSAGKMAEGLPLSEQTLELRKSKLGAAHPDTLASMNNLAEAYRTAGKLEKAISLSEQTLELMKTKLGPEHPSTLASMNNLALAYHAAERLTEALPLYEEALELQKAKFGSEHPDTLGVMHNLAQAYRSAGKLEEALLLLERTVELQQAKLGSGHVHTLTSMNNLAMAYDAAGRPAKALPLYEQTLEVSRANLGPEHPSTLLSMGNLATAYLEKEYPEKALPLFDLFIVSHRKRATPDDSAFAGMLAIVSLKLLKHRQYAAAETYLRECLTICEKKLPNDWLLFRTKSMLGGAMAGQKKFEDAEPLLLAGYQGMKDREAKIPPQGKVRLTEALERLVQLYDAWEKKDEADKWRKKLEEHKTALEAGKPAGESAPK